MNELLPGVMVAVVPAMLTIAYQLVTARGNHERQRHERLTQLLLDLRGEAEEMTYQGVFSDAHLYAVGKASSSPAIILGHLPAFDLNGMSRDLAARFSRIHRLSNELTAITEKESTHLAIKRAVDATMTLLHAYMVPSETRPKFARLLSARPPLDQAMVAARTATFESTFRGLEHALSGQPKTKWGRPSWP